MKDFQPMIYIFWSVIGAALVYSTHAMYSQALVASLAMAWVGLLVGISFTEAWIKFRAPLLERHVAFDVGRHVFTALNTVEVAVMQTMLLTLIKYGSGKAQWEDPEWSIPITLGILLLSQVGFLTPALEMRAEKTIHELLAQRQHATAAEENMFKLLSAKLVFQRTPPKALHQIYILVEVVKLGLLITLAVHLARPDPA